MKPTKFPRAKPPRLSVPEVKALVRFRDGYRCRLCGMTAREHVRRFGRTLDVHRLVPGSRYRVAGCIAVCKACHKGQPRSRRVKDRCVNGRVKVAFNIPPELFVRLSLDAATSASRVSAVAVRILSEHYAAKGLWPPPSARP